MLWTLVCIAFATTTALTAAAPQHQRAGSNPLAVFAQSIKKQSKTARISSATPLAPVSTSANSAAEPSITQTPKNTSRTGSADCSCGYVLTSHDNAYYPLAIVVDFKQISSIDQFANLGLKISTGRIGGVNRDDGVTLCRSDASNFRFTSEGMEMVVPGKSSAIPTFYSHRSRLNIVPFPSGGQPLGGEITGAELQSIDKMTYGHLSMNAQLSPVHGTCQALFTYIDEAGFPEAGDEQDIEILAHKMDEGVVLTNWNPEGYHVQHNTTLVPFPSPPTTSFHNYTLTWPASNVANRETRYYFDNQLINTFDQYVSINPSGAYINNWSNGQASFTQGPPTDDSVLRVRSLAWYYGTAEKSGLPAGCSIEEACRVD